MLEQWGGGGGGARYVMVSKFQWKPFLLATQLFPQNDWTGWQNGVNDDVCTQAPRDSVLFSHPYSFFCHDRTHPNRNIVIFFPSSVLQSLLLAYSPFTPDLKKFVAVRLVPSESVDQISNSATSTTPWIAPINGFAPATTVNSLFSCSHTINPLSYFPLAFCSPARCCANPMSLSFPVTSKHKLW